MGAPELCFAHLGSTTAEALYIRDLCVYVIHVHRSKPTKTTHFFSFFPALFFRNKYAEQREQKKIPFDKITNNYSKRLKLQSHAFAKIDKHFINVTCVFRSQPDVDFVKSRSRAGTQFQMGKPGKEYEYVAVALELDFGQGLNTVKVRPITLFKVSIQSLTPFFLYDVSVVNILTVET